MLTTVRVQEKGQVTIPSSIRRKLKLKKGDLVTFAVKENGVVIQSLDAAVKDLLGKLDKILSARGASIQAILASIQKDGGEAAAVEFSLNEVEKSILYTALQLQAQQALETIRSQAEQGGLNQLSDTEIEAEIQAARHDDPFFDRS